MEHRGAVQLRLAPDAHTQVPGAHRQVRLGSAPMSRRRSQASKSTELNHCYPTKLNVVLPCHAGALKPDRAAFAAALKAAGATQDCVCIHVGDRSKP